MATKAIELTAEKTLRSQDEIVAYYKGSVKDDWLGVIFGDCAAFLDAEHLRPLCKPDADLSEHQPEQCIRSVVVEKMRDYMPFAWGKANGERGISANRSIQHFDVWLWMLGDDDTLAFVRNWDNYPMYGKPMLQKICEVYGFEKS